MPTVSAFRPATNSLCHSTPRRVGLVSTYPPKICGLATFATALETALVGNGHQVDSVRVVQPNEPPSVGRAVSAELVNGSPASRARVVAALSRCDVAIVQHEYGIYGGADGDEVIDLLRSITVPTIAILHTVPARPTDHQRSVLIAVVDMADSAVVMTEVAKRRLTELYGIDPAAVVVIPHGASVPAQLLGVADTSEVGPDLLTWGLLGPGKGIEHAIDALALLPRNRPAPRYTVAGVTHPNVRARDGYRYRDFLVDRARAKGVGGSVTFDSAYRSVENLTRFVASASVVLLPYDSREQVTSGVLVDAIAAGRPVIATAFPHAVELLSTGAGIVVPHADPVALAAAIRLVLDDSSARDSMAAEARRIAPALRWSAVAERYAKLSEVLVERQSVAI